MHPPHSHLFLASGLKSCQTRAAGRALYATVRGLSENPPADSEEPPPHGNNDFILSILRANPSLRDSRSYLASFGPRPQTKVPKTSDPLDTRKAPVGIVLPDLDAKTTLAGEDTKPIPIVESILDPVIRRTALVKIQGPFTDIQLDSIARGLVYLEKLGLVSVIVVENDTLSRGDENDRSAIIEETMRVVSMLEKNGAKARPMLGSIVRLGPKPSDDHEPHTSDIRMPEAHTVPSDLVTLRSSLRAGEIPVIPPFALDSFCRSVRIHSNDVLAALARGMVEAGSKSTQASGDGYSASSDDVDLTPLRLMIINREGGVPSYARSGYPHLLINLASETSHIQETFQQHWRESHPTALSNLALARTCLNFMPPTASATMVSHRSPSSLIGNLITNKPALSSSLPHALLQGNRKLTPHTPTLLRRGLDIRVVRTLEDVDWNKLTLLLEQSFQRKLDGKAFYNRLKTNLDFIIVAGDYVGAAIVTNEPCPGSTVPISYLDKFAVLPSHQGDGTVDFLWVALHDESYGLGHPSSVNPNGGKEGRGEGQDLVWRSRANNPVNKWYFERSTGHIRSGSWVLFWCDAEKRLRTEQGRRGSAGLSYIEGWERGRLSTWTDVIMKVPSVWK